MKKALLICFSLLLSYLSEGQDAPLLFEGKIDKYPVVMEMSFYDTSCTIKYFYLNRRKDINLDGVISADGEIRAESFYTGDETTAKELINLRKTASGYAGSWISGNKKLPMSLIKASVDKYKNPHGSLPGIEALKKEDAYSYIKILGLSFTRDTSAQKGTQQLEWYKEKYSGIIMPRLKSGYQPAVLKKINSVLLEKHLLESNNFLDCSADRYGEYELSVDETFIHRNVFSININVGYYCGGAHPDFGSEGLNFNGQTGDLLKLDDVIWFGKTKPPAEESNDWFDYRNKVFAPKIVELLTKIYPTEMKRPAGTDDDQCDYADPEAWDFPNWHFTEKGLYLGAYFARVARVCDSPGWSVIPYKILKSYLNPVDKFRLPD